MILYLHGINSSPASHKARTLRSCLGARGLAHQFACPTLPHRAAEAVALIESEIARHGGRPTLVGSSLGGFYATHFAGRAGLRAVLINPERYLLLLETGDEVLDWRMAARKYEGARTVIRSGGDHSLQSFAEHIPRILAFAGLQARA